MIKINAPSLTASEAIFATVVSSARVDLRLEKRFPKVSSKQFCRPDGHDRRGYQGANGDGREPKSDEPLRKNFDKERWNRLVRVCHFHIVGDRHVAKKSDQTLKAACKQAKESRSIEWFAHLRN